MEKIRIDRAAEAPDYEAGHGERHAKIKVAAQKCLEPVRCADVCLDMSGQS
jgi:hypothetical protein